eukprot:350318-Chlamydomonas_euryale.AAC.11
MRSQHIHCNRFHSCGVVPNGPVVSDDSFDLPVDKHVTGIGAPSYRRTSINCIVFPSSLPEARVQLIAVEINSMSMSVQILWCSSNKNHSVYCLRNVLMR